MDTSSRSHIETIKTKKFYISLAWIHLSLIQLPKIHSACGSEAGPLHLQLQKTLSTSYLSILYKFVSKTETPNNKKTLKKSSEKILNKNIFIKYTVAAKSIRTRDFSIIT